MYTGTNEKQRSEIWFQFIFKFLLICAGKPVAVTSNRGLGKVPVRPGANHQVELQYYQRKHTHPQPGEITSRLFNQRAQRWYRCGQNRCDAWSSKTQCLISAVLWSVRLPGYGLRR